MKSGLIYQEHIQQLKNLKTERLHPNRTGHNPSPFYISKTYLKTVFVQENHNVRIDIIASVLKATLLANNL